MSQGFREQVALASVITERWYMAPGVRRVDIKEGGVTGTLFLPSGPGPFPGVLDLWGGGGSLVEYRAALLASHGFAVMALIYLFPDHKKNTTIGYPYFENAFRLLQDHPLVATDRIALLGISFGVTVVLSITAYSETVKPRCCVCISGTHTGRIGATQSIADTSNRIEKQYKKACRDENNRLIWRDVFLPIPEDIELKVEMGRITCPLLLVVGQDDQNNATVEADDDMKKMMERAGNSHLLTTLSYPGAGHLIEPLYSPHCKVSSFRMTKSRESVDAVGRPHHTSHRCTGRLMGEDSRFSARASLSQCQTPCAVQIVSIVLRQVASLLRMGEGFLQEHLFQSVEQQSGFLVHQHTVEQKYA